MLMLMQGKRPRLIMCLLLALAINKLGHEGLSGLHGGASIDFGVINRVLNPAVHAHLKKKLNHEPHFDGG